MSTEISLRAPPNTPEREFKSSSSESFHGRKVTQASKSLVPALGSFVAIQRIYPQHISSHKTKSIDEMRESSPGSFVSFIVGEKRFEADRNLLIKSECSDYFKEKLKLNKFPIVIDDLSPAAFEALINHFKTGYFLNPIHIHYELYRFFQARNCKSLVESLENKILGELSWRSLWFHLMAARQYIRKTALYKRLFTIAVQHPAYLWIRLDRISPRFFLEILQHDQLGVGSEISLFGLIHTWCQLQNIKEPSFINECLDHIRLELCEPRELPHYFRKLPLLSREKATGIFIDCMLCKKAGVSRRNFPPFTDFEEFELCTKAVRQRQQDALIISHSFNMAQGTIKIPFKIDRVACTLSIQKIKKLTHIFKLESSGEAPLNNSCFLWLQAEDEPDTPFVQNFQFSDSQIDLDGLPDNQIIRLALTILKADKKAE